MGWNSVSLAGNDPLTEGLQSEDDQCYFLNSYYIDPEDISFVMFETDYVCCFVSVIRSGYCYATQFHPEKSQAKGLQLYRTFLKSL